MPLSACLWASATTSLLSRTAASRCRVSDGGLGSVGVIGGGMAGVTAARALADAGLVVVLHEQDAQLGGRLAASACSYIKGTEPEFVAQLQRWETEGRVAEWREARPHLITAPGVWTPIRGDGKDDERWFVGRPHMGSAVDLADDDRIEVRRGEVFAVNCEGGKWVVATAEPSAEVSSPSEDNAEATILEAEAPPLASHLHSALVIATPVDAAAQFLERKVRERALDRQRPTD